jgi:two-component system, chemotaxis family, protein-glutamate methylesterase/glutaminase
MSRKARPSKMPSKGRNIIVVGTAAGGLEALDQLIGQLPTDLPASIFIVQHTDPHNSGEPLLRRLSRHKAFQPKLAEDGDRFKPGHVYIAPPDNHLLLKKNRLLVTKGARENRNRPAIDPLFRSAAVAHGSRVIGVVLSGMEDDGTAGLIAIKRCGGVTVVQDPRDAAYSGMPLSALDNANVDYCVSISDMGPVLTTLVSKLHGKSKAVPEDVRTEAIIAERVLSDISQVNTLGEQVPYNCPGCGGVLWKIDGPGEKRYRCHTGHSYTGLSLLASQSEKIEEMLWISLRMFEERKNLLASMTEDAANAAVRRRNRQQAKETQGYIDRIRAMLLDPRSDRPEDTLTHVKALMAEPRKAKSTR